MHLFNSWNPHFPDMKYFLSCAIFLGVLFLTTPIRAQKQTYKEVLLLMGTRFELSVVTEDSLMARQSIDLAIAEVKRIEALISSWDPKSQTSEINRQAGISAVVVDKELIDLILRSKKVSQLTQGAFDISFASIDHLWKFDGSVKTLPNEDDIRASVEKINYQNIIVDQEQSTVFLKEKGMKVGFGAIGKGYAANRARVIMQQNGISAGVVNAAGDLIVWGKQQNGQPWNIGVTDPAEKSRIMGWISVEEMAVVTSGDYEQFIMIDGKRYAHIIDPRTGYPSTGIKSVTIICPDAELADALATSVFVLGKDNGMKLINQLNGIEGFIITDDDELLSTNNLSFNYLKENSEKTFEHQIGGH